MSRADRVRAPRDQRLARPTAWIAPVLGAALTMVAWFAVAHSSGVGWVQATGALLGGVLVVGLVAPSVPATRARIRVAEAPGDGRAGQPLVLVLEADRPVRLRPRSPAGGTVVAGGPLTGPRLAEVVCVPTRRGVLADVVVEVASSAPFGLLWWSRRVHLALPRPLHVAPRPVASAPGVRRREGAEGESATRVPRPLGEPRGVRPYAPGDPRRGVHWPATAHAGVLMVRESERPQDAPRFIDAALPADDEAAERRAEEVQAEVAALLDRGEAVVLATHETAGAVVRTVSDRTDLGRRLARAVPAGPTTTPAGGSR